MKMDFDSESNFGLLVISGFLERFYEEIKEHSGDSGSSEIFKSEIDPYYYEKEAKRKR